MSEHAVWCIGWVPENVGGLRKHTGPCNCQPANIARCPHCGMAGLNECWCGEYDDRRGGVSPHDEVGENPTDSQEDKT